jgi:hemolysin III
LAEEIAHTLTHGVGILLSIGGLAVLVAFAALYGDAWHIVSSSVYGATLILLYTASTLYHGIPHPQAKSVLKQIDHAAIFLLIAGTYTPFTLVSLRGPWGWSLFGVVWGIALLGVLLELLGPARWRRWSLLLYLGLGWLVIVAVKPMLSAVEPGGLWLLLGGGLAYTLGALFYAWDRLTFNHAIWHLFVLLGSILHFFSVFFYVLPGSG